MLPTTNTPIPSEIKTASNKMYKYYAAIIGFFTSIISIIFLVAEFLTIPDHLGSACFQVGIAFTIFGLLCGIAGTMMAIIPNLEDKIKCASIINVITLIFAALGYLIATVIWISILQWHSIVGLIIAILYCIVPCSME